MRRMAWVLVALGVTFACGERAVELVRVQVEGKKAIGASEWVAGRGVAEGDVLGASK